MKTTMRLFLLFCAVFMASQPVLAQNDEDTRNKAVITTDDGDRQLITDEISVIRFDGPKVTVVQPWGDTVFDRTLRNLTFLRPLPGTLRLTVNLSKDDDAGTTRGHSLNGEGALLSTWSSTDRVYVYADAISTTPIGTLTPVTIGGQVSKMSGNIELDGLEEGNTLYLSTQPRPHSFATQTGAVEDAAMFYLTTTADVTSIIGGNATTADATFSLAQAIVRFTLEDGSNNAVSAKELVISDGASTITVTPTSATNVLYVAMPAAASTAYSLTATDNSNREWTGSKTAALDKGYYRTTVAMTKTKLNPSVTAPTAKALTYTGSEQALVNDDGSTTGGTLCYIATSTNSAPDIDAAGWATTIPTGTNAGTYYVWTKVTGNVDYNDVGVSATSVEVTIGQKALTITANDQTIAYGASIATGIAQVTPTGLVDGDALTDITLTASGSDVTTTGTITPSAAETTNGIGNYSVTYTAGNLTITAVSASVTTAPAAVTGELTYNGSAQALVTGGDATGGTLKYFVNTTGTAPTTETAGWLTSVPTCIEAGTYYVWYYVAGDGNHTSTAVTAIEGDSKTISPKALTITANDQTIAYGASIATGIAQVTPTGLVDGDALTDITLTASGSDVTTTGTITPSAAETTNGIDNYSVTYTAGNLTITAVSASVTTAAAAVTGELTYNGSAQALVTGGVATGGTLKYFVNTTGTAPTTETAGWLTSVPTGTAAGTYYVWYYVAGDGNHTSTAVTAIEGASKIIGKKALTVTAEAKSRNYGAANPALTYTHGDLATGDDESVFNGALACAATTESVPDEYNITQGTLTAGDNYEISYTGAMLTVLPVLDLSSVTANTTVPGGVTVTGTLGGNYKISIADGATVTLSDVTINGVNNGNYGWAGLNCEGNATINLADGTTNTVKGFHENYPGIHVPSTKTLTIQGMGTLNASSNGKGAGIGGGRNISCGIIIINGGIITASGGSYAAGIGSGGDLNGSPNCGDITINGGTIMATGGSRGAGIGSAFGNGSCGNITISGGIVTATGGTDGGAGIGGGGYNGRCGDITISGGEVTATGGGGAEGATGIGSGRQSSYNSITISGGTIIANGGTNGAGIGTGYCANGGDILISGGTVTATGSGNNSVGIGAGYGSNYHCGNITIENTVTRVTATKSANAVHSIGICYNGRSNCGTVSIGGNVGAISTSPYTYNPAIDLATISSDYTAQDHDILTGTLGSNVQISVADGARITLRNATISSGNYAGLTCLGSATITLQGSNTMTGAWAKAGIQIGGTGTTLTIEGPGSLQANGGGQSAGIGIGRAWSAGTVTGGNIVINGGTITAQGGSQWGAGIGTGAAYATAVTIGNITINGGEVTATGGSQGGAAGIGTSYTYGNASTNMGDITINGGTVNATGNGGAAGIGTGESNGSPVNRVGSITIISTVTRVTATKGSNATHSIGKGASSSGFGTVTIGGVEGAISTSPYTYQPPASP